ncbi:hypothetical protein B188_09290 [Candidatus Brocadiaceae bacterium B188]|nr:hypothetical protein B188_09290 [Candidatus Brocadiaceae bacterium B188]
MKIRWISNVVPCYILKNYYRIVLINIFKMANKLTGAEQDEAKT